MHTVEKFANLEELDIYFKEIESTQPLTAQEEIELSRKIQAGDEEALNKMITSNLKFVVKYAKKYRSSGVPYSDLISEGNIGLMKAAKKFDGSKGVRFASYAAFWIKDAIQDCIHDYYGGMTISEYTNTTIDIENVQEQDFETSTKAVNEEFENNFMLMQGRDAAITELMKCLKEREIKILSLYFGLYGQDEMTLDEIGETMHLTMERVRQIKDKALTKLRVNALLCDDFHNFKSLA